MLDAVDRADIKLVWIVRTSPLWLPKPIYRTDPASKSLLMLIRGYGLSVNPSCLQIGSSFVELLIIIPVEVLLILPSLLLYYGWGALFFVRRMLSLLLLGCGFLVYEPCYELNLWRLFYGGCFHLFVLFGAYKHPPLEWLYVFCACAGGILLVRGSLGHLGLAVCTVNDSLWSFLLQSLEGVFDKGLIEVRATYVLADNLACLHYLLHEDVVGPCLLVLLVLLQALDDSLPLEP